MNRNILLLRLSLACSAISTVLSCNNMDMEIEFSSLLLSSSLPNTETSERVESTESKFFGRLFSPKTMISDDQAINYIKDKVFKNIDGTESVTNKIVNLLPLLDRNIGNYITIASVFEKGMTCYPVEYIINLIKTVERDNIANFINQTDRLLYNEIDGMQVIAIMEAINSIPTSEVNNIIETSTPILDYVESGFDKAIVIESVASLDFDEMNDIIEYTLSLMNQISLNRRMEGSEISDIIKAIKNTSFAQRDYLVGKVKTLNDKSLDGYQVADAIKLLQLTPTHYMNNQNCNLALNIFSKKMDLYARQDILKDIFKVKWSRDRLDRIRIISEASSLFSEHMTGSEVFDIIEVIDNMLQSQRANIIPKVASILNKEINGHQITDTIKVLLMIPEPDQLTRNDCMIVSKLFNDDMSAYDRKRIIQIIANTWPLKRMPKIRALVELLNISEK